MEDWLKDIGKTLEPHLVGHVSYNEEMAGHTSYRIGGPAEVFIELQALEDLEKVAQFLASHPQVPYEILGGGSNVLYPERYRGIVMHPGEKLSGIRREGDLVIAGAGAKLMDVIKQAAQWKLNGMDFLAGIPGSIGGAVKGNAGAFGHWISERVESLKGFDLAQRAAVEMKKADVVWSYRRTSILPALFIYEVSLRLEPCPVMECMDRLSRVLAERGAKLPKEPSAGCVFINPKLPDVTAGRLIDELGFKGQRVGDAMCSPQHANFIVNLGHATQSDVLALIEKIKQAVKERYGYDLREEIKIIKEKGGS